MKKKLVFLSLTSVASLAIVASAVAISTRASKQIERTLGTEYQLVISDPLYTGEGTQTVAEQKVLKTGLGNDVKVEYNGFTAYKEGYQHEYSTGINCWENRVDGYLEVIANAEGNGIAGIKSVELKVDNDSYGEPQIAIDYGWAQGNYISREVQDSDDSTHSRVYYLSDSQPTFIKIIPISTDTRNVFGLHEIIITYTCVETENPFAIEGDFILTKHGDIYGVSQYTGTDTELVFPSEHDGHPVTLIEDNFQTNRINKDTITTVSLPSSITAIGTDAFRFAERLTTINLGNVQTIGDGAFYRNDLLNNIDLSSATYIGEEAFYRCAALNVIGGLDSIETICDSAFEASPLEGMDLVFPESVISIGDAAFMSTHLHSVTIPDAAVVEVKGAAFRSSRIVSIYIGDNTNFYDELTFCSNLTTITVGENNEHSTAVDNVLYRVYGENNWTLVRIAQYREQTSYVMPDQVANMYSYCAYNSITLQSLTFNNRITSVEDYAFNGCGNLEEVTFGSSIRSIKNSFTYCGFDKLYFPANITTIYQQAFRGCTGLRSVEFAPEGCTHISGQAFMNCENLTSALLPKTLTNVGANESWSSENDPDIFSGCTSLTKVMTYLESGEEYTGTIRDGWLGGRTLIYLSDHTEAGTWHYETNGTKTIKIQSNATFSGDGTWYAVWAWNSTYDGYFYYDHNAPVDYLYTIEIPENYNYVIILRMKAGVDASTITVDYPTGQFWNASQNQQPGNNDLATITGWGLDISWSQSA